MSHSQMCLFKREQLSLRLGKNIALNVVHELCDMLLEAGVAFNAEDVLQFIKTAEIDVLEDWVRQAEERFRRKKRLRESQSYRYEYVYTT